MKLEHVGYRSDGTGGFFEGLLGCLRPVWTIIGKAAQAEIKMKGWLFERVFKKQFLFFISVFVMCI